MTQEEKEFEERLKINEECQRERDKITDMSAEQRKKYCSGIQNLTFEFIAPRPKAQGWMCMIAGCDGQKMNLLPVSQDVPAEYWECTHCKRRITIAERDQVFVSITQNIQDGHQLKTFQYDKMTNQHTIESSEWPGQTRIGATRKKITSTERQGLIDQLLNTVEDTLSIHVNSIKDYFLES